MTSKYAIGLGLVLLGLLAFVGTAFAEETCTDCAAAVQPETPCPTNWIELGVPFNDVDHNEKSHNQFGEYPTDWLSSGRLNLGADYLRRERFELRWDDATTGNGHVWNRIAYAPLTLEWDAAVMGSYTLDTRFAPDALREQEITRDSIKLRLHRGEFDNMVFGYERGEWNRKPGYLGSYEYDRLRFGYNFNAMREGKLRGQFATTATEYDAPVVGIDGGQIATTALKLDAALGCKVDAYGRASQTKYKYDEMADDEAAGSDTTVGLRYRPTSMFEFEANYRTKSNADDNVVTSHVDCYDQYGVQMNITPCNGNRYEFGYDHRALDYKRLRLIDAGVMDTLRGPAAVTPGQLAGHYDTVEPEQDHYWYSFNHKLTRKLGVSSRLDYRTGDTPQTTLGGAYTPTLFSDKNIVQRHMLTYDYDPANQLTVAYNGISSRNADRDSAYGQDYLEGSWWHSFGQGRSLLLAYRSSQSTFDVPTLLDIYNSDDDTYLANFHHEMNDFSYGLNLSRTKSSGYEDYTETAAGADLSFKRLGPVGVRMDWFDRQYGSLPGLDTEAMEFALTYKFDF